MAHNVSRIARGHNTAPASSEGGADASAKRVIYRVKDVRHQRRPAIPHIVIMKGLQFLISLAILHLPKAEHMTLTPGDGQRAVTVKAQILARFHHLHERLFLFGRLGRKALRHLHPSVDRSRLTSVLNHVKLRSCVASMFAQRRGICETMGRPIVPEHVFGLEAIDGGVHWVHDIVQKRHRRVDVALHVRGSLSFLRLPDTEDLTRANHTVMGVEACRIPALFLLLTELWVTFVPPILR